MFLHNYFRPNNPLGLIDNTINIKTNKDEELNNNNNSFNKVNTFYLKSLSPPMSVLSIKKDKDSKYSRQLEQSSNQSTNQSIDQSINLGPSSANVFLIVVGPSPG